MSTSSQRIVLASRPEGLPAPENFRLEDAVLPSPSEGEILVRVIYLSLDPYMRGALDDAKSYREPVAIGATIIGGGVAQVLESRNDRFLPGDYVNGMFGWCSHALSDGRAVRKLDPAHAPISTALGVLGMPGFTAYTGLLVHATPGSGETLVVSAATGAVGSLAGQLGKSSGLRVVGVAGGQEKCRFAVEELGLDACVDHRDAGFELALREACPDGVDIYYENVGGRTLLGVMPLMNTGGRIPVCGMISWYNAGAAVEDADENALRRVWRTILVQRLSVRGFIITDHYDAFEAFVEDLGARIRAGQIKYRESIRQNLASAPDAFVSLLTGGNFGKQLIQVSDDPTRSS